MSELMGDLLLHPIRLRIVQALVGQPMTAGELKNVLGDVAQATLYRHIKALEAGHLIEIIAERPIRGTVERTYGVVEEAVSLSADDLADAGIDDHFRFFATFVGTLLADFAAYLGAEPADLRSDGVGYRQAALWLSDEEFDELMAELRSAVQRRIGSEPTPQRRRRLLTTIVMPDDRTTNTDRGIVDHPPPA
jgi:DNA-binding transcriptional ArsR family regulator